jgi:hypothetical protein
MKIIRRATADEIRIEPRGRRALHCRGNQARHLADGVADLVEFVMEDVTHDRTIRRPDNRTVLAA